MKTFLKSLLVVLALAVPAGAYAATSMEPLGVSDCCDACPCCD